ncbi:MAG: undecaprenyl-phosphate glucose phosphotransferase [Chlamydiae bacterium]|nr:undecaprenyl-phosphate glucose phosphotransferase [Chlamydiota bacterium]MBI3278183.1 undecaprenyl-phosphate glucose phosphotransferase [Chlamydiota bacterium]
MAKPRWVDFGMGIGQVLVDGLIFYLTFYLAFWIRFHSGLLEVTRGIPSFHLYLENFPAATIVMLLIFKSMNLYGKKGLVRGVRSSQVIKAVGLGMMVLMAITFVYRDVSYSRMLVVVAWFLCCLTILMGRKLLEKLDRSLYQRLGLKKRVLVLGTNELSEKVMNGLKAYGEFYEVLGALSDSSHEFSKKDLAPILGSLSDLPQILSKKKVDEVILTISELEQSKIIEIIFDCEKEMAHFRMIPNLFEMLTSQVEIENFYGVTLLGLKQFPLEKTMNRFWKRGVDILGSILGLTVGFPVFILLAAWVKKDSWGPIFYRQERVGEDGKVFTLVKFRTMRVDAEEKSGPVWATEDDPRRTGLGRFLRKYNLDELPQLWNVLKGEMSLVGPRPERPHFVNEFKMRVPRYMSRHKIKSGMTGWAQVNGLRGNTSISERLKYDLYYLENWSILFDIKIILKTLSNQKNAY